MIKKPRTFEQFPDDKICPFCGTNENAECVLLGIDGTQEGHIQQALPVHLWCAVATNYHPGLKLAYKKRL